MTTDIPRNTAFVAQRLPNWVKALDRDTLDTLGASLLLEQHQAGGDAAWFSTATAAQRQALQASQAHRAACRQHLRTVLPELKSVLAYSEGLLRDRLLSTFGQDIDVHNTRLVYVRATSSFGGLVQRYEAVEQSLLLAALHNFTDGQAFTANSGVVRAEGYSIDTVSPEVSTVPQSNNYGDSGLDFAELQGMSEPFPLFRFAPQARLDMTPKAFAETCRALDLGQAYQDYLERTLLAPQDQAAIREAMIALRRADFVTACQVALLKGDIDQAAFALLEQCRLGQPMVLEGQVMQAFGISMLGEALNDVVIFLPADSAATDQPCIAWLAGDLQSPLKRYASSGAFMAQLHARLGETQYRDSFLGRVSLSVRVAFSARLNARRAADPGRQPNYDVSTTPWALPLFDTLQDEHWRWLRGQALCLAIPTARVDYLAQIDRWEGWLDTGLNVLNACALFVPGLGPLLLPVMGAQMMGELYHGLADLADHQTAAGWSHLAGLALNIGLAAGLHQGLKLYNEIDPFVDSLMPVQLPDGSARLWHPDVRPYASTLPIDPRWRPNAAGLYEVQGTEYLALEGQLYPTQVDEVSGERRIVRPDDRAAYRPQVQGSVHSGWWYSGERPADWDVARLLRRLEPRAAGLDDESLLRALRLADVDENSLRQALVQGQSVPWELSDLLQRYATAHEVDRVIDGIETHQALTSLHPLPVSALVQLPTWPQDLMLKVYEGSEPWGPYTEYGVDQPHTRRVEVQRSDFNEPDRLERLLTKMGDEATATLMGEGGPASRPEQVRLLEQRLAAHLRAQRQALYEQWHASESALTEHPFAPPSDEQALLRQFPGLSTPLVGELVDGASSTERALLGQGRVPLRLAEQAHHVQRQLRLNRALFEWAFYPEHSASPSPDAQRLRAAGLTTDNRQAAARVLGQVDAQPWFRPPSRRSDGRIGYELSGRGVTRGQQDGTLDERLQRLYPHLNSNGRAAIRSELHGDPSAQVTALENEYDTLSQDLHAWAHEPALGLEPTAAARRGAARREIARRICSAWRRELATPFSRNMARFGPGLDLSGLQAGGLPTVTVGMRHLQWLGLRDMGLIDEDVERFLPSFDPVSRVDLSHNALTRMPPQLAAYSRLTSLDLSHNQLHWQSDLFSGLQTLPLRNLNLSTNPLLLSGEGIRALFRLETLHNLDLGHAQLTLTAADINLLARMGLYRLNLQDNLITLDEAGAGAFAHMTDLTHLRLDGNPLGRSPQLAGLHQLAYVNLSNTGLSQWPSGLLALMNAPLPALRQVWLLNNPIVEVPRLAGSPFVSATRSAPVTPIMIDDLALSPQSLQNLREMGIEPLLANAPGWLLGSSATLRTRYRALRDDSGSANFLLALERATTTADYRANPVEQQLQMTGLLLDLTPEPPQVGMDDLRRQLYQAADEAQATCGDGLELLYGHARNLIQVYKVLSRADLAVPGSALPAVELGRGLYQLDLVDEYARDLCNRRVARRQVIYPDAATADALGGAHRPTLSHDLSDFEAPEAALQPYDVITDEDLQDAPDEAEIRLKLRLLLAHTLELPNTPQQMLYSTPLEQSTADHIARLVRARTTRAPLLDWMVLQKYWEFFLQRAQPSRLAEFEQRWENGYLAVFELSHPDPEAVPLTDEVLAVFREYLPDRDWHSADLFHRVQLTRTDADVLTGALDNRRELARRQLYRTLTEPFVDALSFDGPDIGGASSNM